MERKLDEGPVTPFTGGVENSGLGWMIRRKEDGTEELLFILSVSSPKLATELRELKGLKVRGEKGKYTFAWRTASAWNKDETELVGTCVEIKLEDGKTGDEILNAITLIPANVCVEVYKYLVEHPPSTIGFLSIESSKFRDVSSNKALTVSSAEGSFYDSWECDEDEVAKIKEDYQQILDRLSKAKIVDKVYGNDFPSSVPFMRPATFGELDE